MFNFVNKVIKNAKIHDTITIENGIVLKLNKWNLTAEIIFSPNASGDIFIPRSIVHESKNYIITEICDCPFDRINHNILSINFSEDSAIKFLSASCLSICSPFMTKIPPNLEKMEFNVSFFKRYFKKLDFYSSNENFSFLDEDKKLVASRYAQNRTGLQCYSLSLNNDFSKPFDNLLLAKTDITEAIIPSTIKNIDYFCFSSCENLKKIEFEEPSSLRSICKNAFINSTIEEFTIPSKVIRLREGWCSHTKNLTRLSVSPENSFFRMIENKILVGKKKDGDQFFNTLVFANRDIKSVVIPSYVEFISECSFEDCQNLQFVKFENNSKLRVIQSYAFAYSNLKSIEIPENVELIGNNAFSLCQHLENVTFSVNAKLETLSDYVFSKTGIKHVVIPPSVKKFDFDAFAYSALENIEFLGDNIDFECRSFSDIQLGSLKLISFPNANKVTFSRMKDLENIKNSTIYICAKGVIKLTFVGSILNTFFDA